jgi:D-alanyl-D-alanine carboxypeptidase
MLRYYGVKTGSTIPAGYCLTTWYKAIDNWSFNKNDIIVIVLGSQTNEQRFSDTRLLVDWFI